MDNRYEIAEQNGMSREFADWFFDNKKAGCGNVWFMMMAAMWEGWQGRASMLDNCTTVELRGHAGCRTKNGLNCHAMLQGADGNSPVIPDGWVACSERMPEVGVKILCFPVNDEPIHATYNGQLWLQDISWSTSDEPIDNVISCNVFHWMPLPAAPKQEVKNG